MDAKEAQDQTKVALEAIMTAEDAKFIADVDVMIQTAIKLGQSQITAITHQHVSIGTIFNYYTNLGFHCTFPDYLQQNGAQIPSLVQQPVNFFGFNWTQYWLNAIGQFHIRNPARMTVQWFIQPPWRRNLNP